LIVGTRFTGAFFFAADLFFTAIRQYSSVCGW
jgi:hypothetical protein